MWAGARGLDRFKDLTVKRAEGAGVLHAVRVRDLPQVCF